MANQYGPWATSIGACGNPQLSTFWRRRLTMLVPASQSSPMLSRRNLLWLGAAAVLMIVVPLARVQAQGEGPQRPAKQTPAGVKDAGLAKQSDGWGPERDGLRTRLLPAQKQYFFGWPAKFRLEMKNFGKQDRTYDPQQVDVNTMRITDPDGKPVPNQRSGCLGTSPQQQRIQDRLAVHDGRRPHQTQATLSINSRLTEQ